ncbi:MAG TPA: SDR family oxidoreductase [Solirubrobacteraceae bacterium]|nr:SDR family oxidoreductase [Solirubrobacteraceae bacterium]
MARTSVVTGSASGIGKATKEVLESRGEKAIGVDLHDADITVDLTTPHGRAALVDQVTELSGGSIDAIHAIAGLALPVPATVGVNFFGMVATLEDLRPLLHSASAPRAVAVTSMASLGPVDNQLVAAMAAGDEAAGLARAEVLAGQPETGGALIYASTKKAIAQWIRRNAPKPEWAGASIPLNAVAPGIIRTPMTAKHTESRESRAAMLELVPMPLNGIAEPIVVARLLAWLGSEENSHMCGQVVFIDDGSDAVIRGDSTW